MPSSEDGLIIESLRQLTEETRELISAISALVAHNNELIQMLLESADIEPAEEETLQHYLDGRRVI